MTTRRFPPPWSVEEQEACFVVWAIYSLLSYSTLITHAAESAEGISII